MREREEIESRFLFILYLLTNKRMHAEAGAKLQPFLHVCIEPCM